MIAVISFYIDGVFALMYAILINLETNSKSPGIPIDPAPAPKALNCCLLHLTSFGWFGVILMYSFKLVNSIM